MRVRYLAAPEVTGRSDTFNVSGLGEVIVFYDDGSAGSELISELEVYLDSSQQWKSLAEAFRARDLVSGDYAAQFCEPRTQQEREKGYVSA